MSVPPAVAGGSGNPPATAGGTDKAIFLTQNLGTGKSMATIGKYCKSYKLSRLRQFPGWTEKSENARKVRTELDGETVEAPRELTDDDYVYLHVDYTVTDGIFIDENIIFNDVTPEWMEFCRDVLGRPSPKGNP